MAHCLSPSLRSGGRLPCPPTRVWSARTAGASLLVLLVSCALRILIGNYIRKACDARLGRQWLSTACTTGRPERVPSCQVLPVVQWSQISQLVCMALCRQPRSQAIVACMRSRAPASDALLNGEDDAQGTVCRYRLMNE
jgi:hypothetical protein